MRYMSQTEYEMARIAGKDSAELASLLGNAVHDITAPLRNMAVYAQIVGDELPEGEYFDSLRESLSILDAIAGGTATELGTMNLHAGSSYGQMQATLAKILPDVVTLLPLVDTSSLDSELQGMLDRIQALQSTYSGKVAELFNIGTGSSGYDLRDNVAKLAIPGLAICIDDDAQLRMADGYSLERVMDNLAGNARNHGNADKLDIAITQDPRYLNIHLVDNGNGIDPYIASRMFEDGVTTGPRGLAAGTGRGLSIVRNKILGVGGNLAVATVPGKGTRFTVGLPLNIVDSYRVSEPTHAQRVERISDSPLAYLG
ncbi:MAG: sensor histidine kinase, partial [Anaerolineales bacterium]|nr:sensor histidine kinase [Anaerolineales bacterium]